ncbi:MAG: hypothetical protein AAF960_26595, partial [Bacteroidota bacterium]
HLAQEEQDLLLDTLPLVTVLIAGADGKIEVSETSWAEKLTDIRSYANEPELNSFYEKVHTNFSDRVSYLSKTIPAETDEGTQIIVDKLADLNPILAKLPHSIAAKLYKSLTSFAKHVARADGGFLKMWSISKEEKALIDLPMLTPIEMPEEEV